MDAIQLENFREAMRETAASLTDAPCREITLIHHNDTDGIAAGAILRKSLMRSGFSVENIPIERIHPAFLQTIHTPGRRLILYADLGGQAADVIYRHIQEGSRVIIIDHHLPAAGEFPALRQVNPEQFGINGDSECAAAAAACFFALALDGGNEDLAALAVLGAVGDRQLTKGRCEGLNTLFLDIAARRGDLRLHGTGADTICFFPLFQGRNLLEVDSLISTLAVSGYYRRGADLALEACMNGPDERALAFSAEMTAIERDRFSREMARIRREGLPSEGRIVWTDVGERFYPLGLKAIGLFCEEIVRHGAAEEEFYVVGFQRFPGENPYLGRFAGRETKVSLRVTPGLRRSIERGERPDLMQLVPGAMEQVGGLADACHRFAAACTIPEERKEELMALLASRASAHKSACANDPSRLVYHDDAQRSIRPFYEAVRGVLPLIVKAISSTVIGIDSHPVTVEVDLAAGLPLFSTVGLPDVAVRESKDRIKAAIKNSGFPFPGHHVTVNLAPADIKKEGTAFDLPIAVAILTAQELIPSAKLADYLLLGELSLDGGVKGIHGALSAAFRTKAMGIRGMILPREDAAEAALVAGIEVIPVDHLSEVVEFLGGRKEIAPVRVDIGELFRQNRDYPFDFCEIRGQQQAKRALEVAAAGGHNLLMIGPPGAGKTMLAQRLVTILPDLSLPEAIETTKIFSVAGLLDRTEGLLGTRPFRAPHHTISDVGLVGGGHIPRPGEISLAHNGVLFIDELPELRKNALESLRQPLEDGRMTITRSSYTVTYPARFMLIAAMNPCPCGYFGERNHPCRCTPQQIRQYQGKISGPLLDRIDIHIEVPSVRYRDLTTREISEPSSAIKDRIERAREIQRSRFPDDATLFNARMTDRQARILCGIDEDSRQLIEMAVDRLGLSARAYTRILKVARTIADLEGGSEIQPSHVAEAIQYRSLDCRLI